MWFAGWESLMRIVLVGVPAYVTLLLLLRLGGKRTLSKFNAFDLVVTVAFGSTLSAGLLNRQIALADMVLAFALLVGLQYAITMAVLRWQKVEQLVKAEPRLLLRKGEFLERAMRAERVTTRDVETAIRAQGMISLEQAEAVILETDGSLSVVGPAGSARSALRNVRGDF